MQNIKNIALLFALWAFSTIFGAVNAQTYYVNLEKDPSGINTTPYLPELEARAAGLAALFDTLGFPGQFKVFAAGFYAEQDFYDTYTYPAAFEALKTRAAALSPYYLLFGRQTDASKGVFSRYWVDLVLPDTGRFECFDEIALGLADNIETKIELLVNTGIGANKGTFATEAGNEKVSMDSLAAIILNYVQCCATSSRGAGGCSPCMLSAQEISEHFRRLNYVAIPIKILNNSSKPKNDSIEKQQSKVSYPRVTKCTNINSIEMDGEAYNDFAQVINNIMTAFPDSNAKAVITDDACICSGGLEYVNQIHNIPSRKTLRIHILRCPDFINPDTLFVDVVFPDHLGVLPFIGHAPIDDLMSNEIRQKFDIIEINNTIKTIFKKNGFSLKNHDNLVPPQFSEKDIFNRIKYKKKIQQDGKIGHSGISEYSNPADFVDVFELPVVNKKQLSYCIGFALAHEFTHQMVTRSVYVIGGEFKSRYFTENQFNFGGHIDNKVNLMVDGAIAMSSRVLSLEGITKWEKDLHNGINSSDIFWLKFLSKGNSDKINHWELISPSHKFLISTGLLLNNCKIKFGNNADEVKCSTRITASKLTLFKVGQYEPF